MSSIPTLSTVLPELWLQVSALANELKANAYNDWSSLIERLDFLSDRGLVDSIEKCIPGWRKIATIKEGITAEHTILVLATSMTLPEYQQTTPQTQCEIEWAALLHDIDKDVSGGKDLTHPFRSAAVAVKAKQILGFEVQAGISTQDIDRWTRLVISSQHELNGQIVHDHSHLTEIVSRLHQLWGKDTSSSRILKAILFHQSLPTLRDWTNPVLLNDQELRMSLSISDMEVLGPLLIADSDSWNIFDEPRLAYLEELRANIAETRRRIRIE
jgi:HD domain